MGDEICCALIGYGYWGRIMERYLACSEYFRLKHVYAPSLKNGVSLEGILSDEQVRAVFLCTPIGTHYQLAGRCLRAGKHVFCEKPLTRNFREAEELASLAREKGLCLQTDYIYLDSPSLRFLKGQMGKIGDILSIRGEICQFGHFYEDDSVLEVLGVHLISAVLFLLGPGCGVKIVDADILRSLGDVITEMEVRMMCRDKIKVTIFCSLLSAVKTRRLCVAGMGGY